MKKNKNHPMMIFYPMCLPHGPLTNTPNEPNVTNKKEKHKAMVRYTDIILKKLVEALEILKIRNNTSYDRFWEGRKLWGGVVNTSRSICRKIATMIFDVDGNQKHELIRLVACYPHLLAQHLRKESDFSVIQHLCKDTSFLEK